MSNLIDSSGRSVQSTANTLKRSQVPSPELNLSPDQMSRLDFHPLGQMLLAELVMPEIKTANGLSIGQSPIDKPFFRVLRFGSPEYNSELLNHAQLGDILFSSSLSAMRVFHRFPRAVLDEGNPDKGVQPVYEDRKIVMMAYSAFDGVLPGYRWTEEQAAQAERKVGTPMIDFADEFVYSIMNDMATAEEAALISVIPLADKMIVERVPPKTKEGSFHMVDIKDHLPFFRILKMPADTGKLTPHLQNMRVGDVVQMNNVNDSMLYPTGLKDSNGKERRIYMVSAGFITGYYPSLHWDYKPQPTSLDDGVTTVEG